MPRPQQQAAPYSPSTLPASHILVRLGPPHGGGTFDTEGIDGVVRRVEMPNRIRRSVFAARGMFAFVELYPSDNTGRLAGEITHVCSGAEIKAWRRAGEWPKEFDDPAPASKAANDESREDSEDDLPENPNRRRAVVEESSSEESSDEE